MTDFDLKQYSPEEWDRIEQAARDDPDAQPWDGQGPVTRFQDLPPERQARLKNAASRPGRGVVSIRLEAEVIDHFRAKGENWEDAVNATLKRAIKAEQAA